MKFRLPAQESVDFTREPVGVLRAVRLAEIPLNTDDTEMDPAPSLQINNIEPSTMAIWMAGNYNAAFGTPIGDDLYPVRIEWKLYLGVDGCMADEDPPTMVTILKDADDLKNRGGRLFQIDCELYTTAWLCAKIVTGVSGSVLSLALRILFGPLSGRPEVVVGSAAG